MRKRLTGKTKLTIIFILGIVVSFIALINLTDTYAASIPFPLPHPDLGCELLSLCTSTASCNGRGMAFGCIIDCEDGARIYCPPVNN